MRRTTAIWLIIASAAILFALVLFMVTMLFAGWDLTKISAKKWETNAYDVNEKITDISISEDTADISVCPATDGKCRVVCYEKKNLKHSVTTDGGKLEIKLIDERKWYEHITFFDFQESSVTVYLPEAVYNSLTVNTDTSDVGISSEFSFSRLDISLSTGDVKCSASVSENAKIEASTGDIELSNANFGLLNISVSTGDVSFLNVNSGDISIRVSTGKTKLSNVSCKSLTTSGSTGKISLSSVIASEKMSITRSTGDVYLEACDAAEIFIETDTGDVEGTLLSEKIFIPKSDTGDVDVPKTVTGGICEIITDTGDIEFYVKN